MRRRLQVLERHCASHARTQDVFFLSVSTRNHIKRQLYIGYSLEWLFRWMRWMVSKTFEYAVSEW